MMNREKYLSNMNEQELFKLMSTRYTGLIDLNEEDPHSLIDWHYPESDIWMEAKCRDDHHNGFLFIQQDKYKVLMEKKNCWYVNSTPNGIYIFDLKDIEEPVWREQSMLKSTYYNNGSTDVIKKLVGDLPTSKAIQIDHLLF
jgi:hypothetical protein